MLLVLVVGATSLWISNQHNSLARDSAERMVQGGFASLEEKLRTVTVDYALWTDVYEAIHTDDIDWIFSNIGTGATETGTADLMIIVKPGETRSYGWSDDSGETPTAALLTPEAIEARLRLLDPLPFDQVLPVHYYARVGDQIWLLAAYRVMPWTGVSAGASDTDLPRLIFGFRIDANLVNEISAEFLIDDIHVGSAVAHGQSALPLPSASGEPVDYVHWNAPRPGAHILRRIALPLGLTLVLLAAAAALVSRHVVKSAQRLERALGAAQAVDHSKTEFLANVTHELRTPMNGIIGVAQLLEQSDLDDEQREMLKIPMTSADRQMSLIRDLHDVSRIDAGRMVLDQRPFQPAATMHEVIDIIQPQAAKKGLDLCTDLDGSEGITLLGDQDAFKQIVTNIAGNAVKFTETGRVELSLEMTRRFDQAHFALRVADTGPGIDPSQQERVFERFVQVDTSLIREAEGTGLGLAIAKSLVELMDGEIRLSSTPGQGSVFTVALAFEVAILAEPQRDAA